MKIINTLLLGLILSSISKAQTVTISIDPNKDQHTISPWIYGRNNNLSDNPSAPLSSSDWIQLKDAGVRMFRENGGNNATKYNWRKKLSSHPDWFNNVYSHDWDYAASSLFSHTEHTQIMMAFQLLGEAASNTGNNFNDNAFTTDSGSTAYQYTHKNWAGGGGPMAYGGNGGNGDPSLYLESWTADSTAGILDHWKELGLDSNRYVYWNMDNEPGIWSSTHDDVAEAPNTPSAEDFIQRYISVAKAVKSKNPNIKLLGPVAANEWQWYNWNNSKISYKGASYCWMEYFIKRLAEEQQASGIRLLDVLDVHFYPGTDNDPATTLQLHRVWFDETYNYPKANGVKVSGSSSWNDGITKEYFFKRCDQWLTEYMGEDHGVTFSISEYGSINTNPNIVACWYASHLGVFAQNNVEVFTPWNWYTGQWETLHLFSNYFGKTSVQSSSSDESTVSAYTSLTENNDSLIVVVVNRNQTSENEIMLDFQHVKALAGTVNAYQLASLPSSETFVSKTNNALENKTYSLSDNALTLTVPKLSVTLLQIPIEQSSLALEDTYLNRSLRVFPNPTREYIKVASSGNSGAMDVSIEDASGRTLLSQQIQDGQSINIQKLTPGIYFVKVRKNGHIQVKKIIKE